MRSLQDIHEEYDFLDSDDFDGVELVLEGGFADLLSYLRAMESLPQRVLWGSVSLKVEQHPRSVLTVRVYTLSRDPNWLEI
mgnify:CR=1 FL=1